MSEGAKPESLTPHEAAQLELDRRKLDLEERRLKLDEQFPRKWGPVLFGAMATISAAIITGGMGALQSCSQRADVKAAAKREASDKEAASQVARDQRTLENDRLAVEMYFKYVDKGAETPEGKRRALLVGNLARGDQVKVFFGDMARGQISDIARSGGTATAPSEAVAGLPNLIQDKKPAAYQLSDFVIYVQYATGGTRSAEAVRQALKSVLSNVPAAQVIDTAKVPAANEIRIYREEHRAVAQRLADLLKRQTGGSFAIKLLGGRGLPNGVMEIWIGRGAANVFAVAVEELPPGLLRKQVRSPLFPSGARAAFSEWYQLCSDPLPPGYAINQVRFELTGDRECGSWAECERVSQTPERACYRFRMQGHSEEVVGDGVRMSRGVLSYTAVNPDAT